MPLSLPSQGSKLPAMTVLARPARLAKPMTRERVRGFLAALADTNPEPESELDFGTPFNLLVAVVLSAQTTDAAVNRATPALFAVAPDPAAMAALGAERIGPYIRSIGLWQGKARNVAELSRLLVERHGGVVPSEREALEALPGVGRKTANVVLNVAFGQATMAVDTHVFRLGNRTGIAPGKDVRVVEDGLVRRIPRDILGRSHHWLILHGRYVCKARAPECWRCVAAEWCNFPDKTPAPAVKPPRKAAEPGRASRVRAVSQTRSSIPMADPSAITEHMEVVGSDGLHVGTVDHVDGQRVKLTKTDPEVGGEHHFLHLDCVEKVENGKVVLNRLAAQAQDEWGVEQVG